MPHRSSLLTCLALPGRRLTMAALPRCLRAAAAEARLLYWEFDKGEKEMKEKSLSFPPNNALLKIYSPVFITFRYF